MNSAHDDIYEEDIQEFRDLIFFLRRCRVHKPCTIKMIGAGGFDPRKHCRICEMDWRSLQRVRIEGKDSYE